MDKLPAITRICGIKTVTPGVEEQLNHVNKDEEDEQLPPAREESETHDEKYVGDRLVVASDGACQDQHGHPALRRAGQGIFSGDGHSYNCAWPTDTYSQGAQRAEIRAAARWVAWAWGPTVLWTDSALVVKGVGRIIEGKQHGMRMHNDLWERIQKGIEAKGRHKFGVEKINGHAKEEDVHGYEELEEKKRRNDQADTLAVKGAHMSTADPVVRATQKHEEARIKDIQKMMIDVAKARYKQITSWSIEGLERKLQEAEESGRLGDGQEGKIEGEEEVWQKPGEQALERIREDAFEDEWDWATAMDMDGNKYPCYPSPSAQGDLENLAGI